MAVQSYRESELVWVNVAHSGEPAEWRPATVTAVTDDGRYRVFEISSLGGPEEVIVGPEYLRPRQEGEGPPADHPPTPLAPEAGDRPSDGGAQVSERPSESGAQAERRPESGAQAAASVVAP